MIVMMMMMMMVVCMYDGCEGNDGSGVDDSIIQK